MIQGVETYSTRGNKGSHRVIDALNPHLGF